jgi:hypothetical protein
MRDVDGPLEREHPVARLRPAAELRLPVLPGM